MRTHHQPLVTVLTPVYNGEAYLEECVESVLAQTYQNYEYIIVNNCSTDRTREIALRYVQRDARVRLHDNDKHVDVIANHNIAFRLISRSAKYCKVVSADDFLFPECIERMVALAEANQSVGIVGSYQLSQNRVRWQGFAYPRAVFPGVEMCRRTVLGGDKAFGFGSPTSTLYRADLVRSTPEFYPNPNPHSDTSACFRVMQESDFGFVYQVLSYERVHELSQTSTSKKINRFHSAHLNDLLTYGPCFLDEKELAMRVSQALADYHRYLALNYFFARREQAFWEYHTARLEELGVPLKRRSLYTSALTALLSELVNPEQALRRLWQRLFSKPPVSVTPEPRTTDVLRTESEGVRAGRGV